jgi:hypothetical protein
MCLGAVVVLLVKVGATGGPAAITELLCQGEAGGCTVVEVEVANGEPFPSLDCPLRPALNRPSFACKIRMSHSHFACPDQPGDCSGRR